MHVHVVHIQHVSSTVTDQSALVYDVRHMTFGQCACSLVYVEAASIRKTKDKLRVDS